MPEVAAAPASEIARKIMILRGQRVLLDADLAALYETTTKALNQAVRRNIARFPADFVFQLSADERQQVVTNCDHLARLKFSRTLPFAFTEHGAIMAAAVLNSPRAVEMSVYVVRAFVRLRELVASSANLARKLDALERSVAALDAGTRQRFDEVYAAIRALMTPPPGKRRPIGFTADLDE